MKPYEGSPGYMGLPRLFTTFSDDTPDVKRFAQVRSYQCSHVRANAHVGGPNLLTSEGIYHLPLERWKQSFFSQRSHLAQRPTFARSSAHRKLAWNGGRSARQKQRQNVL